jgi:hypothetical protein
MKISLKKTAAVPNSSLQSRSIWRSAILAATAMALVSTTQASAAVFGTESNSSHVALYQVDSNDDDTYNGDWKEVCEREFFANGDYYDACRGASQ